MAHIPSVASKTQKLLSQNCDRSSVPELSIDNVHSRVGYIQDDGTKILAKRSVALENLPDVCIMRMMTFLDQQEFCALGSTSKSMHRRLNDLYFQKWGSSGNVRHNIGFCLWNMEDRSSFSYYNKAYIYLSSRQKQNLEALFHRSIYSMQEQTDAVLHEIFQAEGENGDLEEIKENLSREFFTNDFDFLCHLLDFETSALAAGRTFHEAYQAYKNSRIEIVKAEAQNVKELYLPFRDLTLLPPEIGKLTSLQKLTLHCNCLTSLPPEIGNCTGLQYLELYKNKLISLPPEIGALINLQQLYLSNNKLISLPPEIGALINLQKLCITNNELTSLPPEIGKLTSLDRLELTTNPFTFLPAEVTSIESLSEIGIYTFPWLDDSQLQKAKAYYAQHQRVPLTKEEFYTIKSL